MPEMMTAWLARAIGGDLTTTDRIVTAVAPAALLLLWFVGGMGVYAIRCARRGPAHDAEIASRGSSVLVGMWVRQYFGWLIAPVVRFVLQLGIPANAVTMLSVLLATGSGVSLAAGRFAMGGWLFVLAAICDFLDGRVARRTGQASQRGALLDSVLDRYSDAVVLAGLAWYYRESWVLLAVLCALVGSMLVSYVRARAEGLHIVMKEVGLMQRTERVVYLGGAVALSPIVEAVVRPMDPHPPHVLAIGGILMLAASTNLTAVHRLLFGLRALGGEDRPLIPRPGQRAHAIGSWLFGVGSEVLLLIGLTSLLVGGGLATTLAAGFGALAEFVTNRTQLSAEDGRGARFAVVGISSALLRGGGVALVLLLPGVGLAVAWVLVRIAVSVAWSMPLRRGYVPFGKPIGHFAEGAGRL